MCNVLSATSLIDAVVTFILQLFLFLLIGLEFLGYVLVRQLVNIIELFSGCEFEKVSCRVVL